MADLEDIKSILNATILSTKSSVTLEQCNRDYKELQGEWIPYRKLGYKSLEEFFEDLPGFKLVKLSNGGYFVEAKKSSDVKHITDLVSRQRPSKSRGSRYHIQRPVRNVRSERTWKPAPSFGYNKSPSKVSSVYNKPKTTNGNYPSVSNRINRAPEPIPNIPLQQQTKPSKPSSNQPAMAPTPRALVKKTLPFQNSTPNVLESGNMPMSKLSGIKPGDILARTQSNTNNYMGMKKEDKNETIVPSQSLPRNTIKSRAANRLTALQNTLQTVEPEFTPIIKTNVTKATVVRKSEPIITLDSLESKLKDMPDNKSQLMKCCEIMKLPQPVVKTVPIKQKRGNLYDCTIKIGDKYSFSTYPNSQSSEVQAVEAASLIGVGQLKKAISEESYPTSDPTVAISRIIKIVSLHSYGLWANTLPNIYKEQHKEYLPENWLELLNQCPNIIKESGMNDMVMLLPNSKVSLSSSTTSLQPMTSETNQKTILCPPTLQFPDDSLWNVYIMSAYSTVEIWLRIVGEEYSDALESLTTDMEMYYLENKKPAMEIVEDGWYALYTDESWLRVRILEINIVHHTALCFLVDNGDEEVYPFQVLFDLPPQFLSLPPQAVLCRLAGLEEYALAGDVDNDKSFLADELIGKVLVAEIIPTPDEKQDDPSIKVVLFDTSTEVDVNINKELLRKFSEKATSPQLPPGVSEVYVMDFTTSGKVCVQIHNDSWKLLQNMLHQISNGPFPIESLQASFGEIIPSPRINYLVKSSSGKWRRGVLRSGVTEDQTGVKCASVRYIDCGRTESVPIKDIVMLERISDALNYFPAQALYLTLHNVGTLNSEQMDKIKNLVPYNSPVLCKQVTPGSAVVELFVRTQPHNVLCSVNNALTLEKELSDKLKCEDLSSDPIVAFNKKKERLFANKNSSFSYNSASVKKERALNIVPEKGTYFDVVVCMASNPRNFVVQPLQHHQELLNLMENMQKVCAKLPKEIVTLSKSKMYAVYHENTSQWYRASFLGMAMKDNPSMYFIDFGDCYTMSIDSLRELPNDFTNLPPMAMKAKLYGVRPKDQDWSVEDCIRFTELVNEQSFASIVKDIEEDPMNNRETILVLDLIDTSTHEDLYVNALLVKEKRAVPIVN